MSAAERKIIEDDARAMKRALSIFKDPERLAQVQKVLGELSEKGGKTNG
jgi:hypothetical protein